MERWSLLPGIAATSTAGGSGGGGGGGASGGGGGDGGGSAVGVSSGMPPAAVGSAPLGGHGDSQGPCLALRRVAGEDADRDAFLVVVGCHFSYARDRAHPLPDFPTAKGGGCANLVDAAYAAGDRAKMLALVDLEGTERLNFDDSRGR